MGLQFVPVWLVIQYSLFQLDQNLVKMKARKGEFELWKNNFGGQNNPKAYQIHFTPEIKQLSASEQLHTRGMYKLAYIQNGLQRTYYYAPTDSNVFLKKKIIQVVWKTILMHTRAKKMEHTYILCFALKLDIDTLISYCQDILI